MCECSKLRSKPMERLNIKHCELICDYLMKYNLEVGPKKFGKTFWLCIHWIRTCILLLFLDGEERWIEDMQLKTFKYDKMKKVEFYYERLMKLVICIQKLLIVLN